MKTKNAVVAEILLYGSQYAAGWLVKLPGGRMLGDGEPQEGRSYNTALWLACGEIREAGITSGQAEVYEATGRFMALCYVANPPYYGDLEWKPAKVYVLSAEDIMAAAVNG
jgi:hypothetical protein